MSPATGTLLDVQDRAADRAADRAVEAAKDVPRYPSGQAGMALALANAIHSCNHVIKHAREYNRVVPAETDRRKLVDALVGLVAVGVPDNDEAA